MLLALSTASAILVWGIHPQSPEWNHSPLASGAITLAQLSSSVSTQSILWLDARSDEEFHDAHIPDAVLLNEDNWSMGLIDFLDRWDPDTKVIVYCSSASCATSKQVARRLRDEIQIKDVYHLEGGWEAWLLENPPPRGF